MYIYIYIYIFRSKNSSRSKNNEYRYTSINIMSTSMHSVHFILHLSVSDIYMLFNIWHHLTTIIAMSVFLLTLIRKYSHSISFFKLSSNTKNTLSWSQGDFKGNEKVPKRKYFSFITPCNVNIVYIRYFRNLSFIYSTLVSPKDYLFRIKYEIIISLLSIYLFLK